MALLNVKVSAMALSKRDQNRKEAALVDDSMKEC